MFADTARVTNVRIINIIIRGGFTLGVQAFEAWLYTFMSHKSH